jgi:single-strand selective monofunctional uracil DNA glycosylase
VEEHCQTHLRTLIETLKPQYLIGVGAYAEKKLTAAAAELTPDAKLGRILHPSPASPAANRDFAGTALRQLEEVGVW